MRGVGGREALCFFCSKNIHAPSGSLLLPAREMTGTRCLAGCAGAPGLLDENGFSHFWNFKACIFFACITKYLSLSPFLAWGVCTTEPPKANFQETDTENCLSSHEKTELKFISSTQLCGDQVLSCFWKGSGGPNGVVWSHTQYIGSFAT